MGTDTRAHTRLTTGVVLGLGLLGSDTARAGDGMRLRTPVLWSESPCMTVVDRSADPVLHLPYEIPFEDAELTDDEVADGRTHQLFALCQGHDPTDELPAWITEADVAAAEAMELVDLGTIDGDAILDLDPQWQGCAERITADDERRPITFAAAAEGVDWDTSAVAAGAWVVEAFTHDPAYSIWSPRPGVIKVVDDPAPAASGPAVAVLNGEEVIEITQAVALEGCVSAMEGTVLSVAWAEVGEDTWQLALEDEPVVAEAFSLDLWFPPQMAGQAARVRVEATDPMGRASLGYMGELVIVLPDFSGCDDGCETTGGPGPGEGSGGGGASGGAGPGPSGSGGVADGGSGAPGATTTGGTGAAEPAAGGDGGGCGCTQAPGPWSRGAPWLLLLLGGVRRRGRGLATR